MASHISIRRGGYGPYSYIVEYRDGEAVWEYLGRTDETDASRYVDGGELTERGRARIDRRQKEAARDGEGEVYQLEGNTADHARSAMRWAENRPIVGERVDEELIMKVKEGREISEEEAVSAEIALRALASNNRSLADKGEHTIMGGPEGLRTRAGWMEDAADDIDTGDEVVDEVLDAYEMHDSRTNEPGKVGRYRGEHMMQEAEGRDVSLSPDEAFGGVGATSEFRGSQNMNDRGIVDGTQVEVGDKPLSDHQKELDELAGEDLAELQGESGGGTFSDDEREVIADLRSSTPADGGEAEALDEVYWENPSELTAEQAQAIENVTRVVEESVNDGEHYRANVSSDLSADDLQAVREKAEGAE